MPERKTYLATSALIAEGFDAHRTAEEATKHGFYGVQLFVNQEYHVPRYVGSLISVLREKNLGLIIHLPNTPSPEDIQAAEDFVEEIPEASVIIHYLPATCLPQVKGTIVGWENSVNSPDLDHVNQTLEKVKADDSFFVFDCGRLMNTNDEDTKQQVRDFIDSVLQKLDPKRDILHLGDKTNWEGKFRESMCPFGEGILAEFLPQVKEFVARGGKVVFEQEDLQMTIDSLKALS
jgi:hypothetical protein